MASFFWILLPMVLEITTKAYRMGSNRVTAPKVIVRGCGNHSVVAAFEPLLLLRLGLLSP
jgi:hypothetical protein